MSDASPETNATEPAKSDQGPALIDLVDSEILAFGPTGDIVRTPGYAVLGDDGIITGEQARSRAWLQPQRSFSHYWHQLNLSPLPAASRHARHNADLAFAQLQALHQALSAPADLVFSLPGNFAGEQLSILLGLANALPANTVGMVDSAVAAASTLSGEGELVHVDVQLNQTLLTRLNLGNRITRGDVIAVTDTGLKALHSSWAQFIADRFIREYRYDPLHTAEGEQQIFDRLPGWLAQLGQYSEITIALATPRGEFRLALAARDLLDSARHRLGRLEQELAKLPGSRIGSHRLAQLPGLARQLAITLLDEQQLYSGCRQALPVLAAQEGVAFVTELPRRQGKGPATTPPRQARPVATHVLMDHSAHAIGGGLGFSAGDKTPVRTGPDDCDLWLGHRDGRLCVETGAQCVSRGDPAALAAGDQLTLGGQTLTLINVEP